MREQVLPIHMICLVEILKPVTLFPPSRPYWLDSPDRHSSCYALPFAPVQPKNINLHPPKWSEYIYHEKVWILWEIHGNSCPASGSQELAFCGWPWKKLSTATACWTVTFQRLSFLSVSASVLRDRTAAFFSMSSKLSLQVWSLVMPRHARWIVMLVPGDRLIAIHGQHVQTLVSFLGKPVA